MKRKSQNKPGTEALVVWSVPTEVKRAFKRMCVARGHTIRFVIVELMMEYAAEGRFHESAKARR